MAPPVPSLTGFEEATDRRQRVRQALDAYHSSRDTAALDFIVSSYQGLALSLASRFAQRGEDMEDLNQVALIGLLKAVERFDPERGTELTTFATATILGELKRHLRDRGWWVRPPRRVHDLYITAQQAMDELTQNLGRSPTVEEVARHISAGTEEVLEALEAGGLRNSTPLDAMVAAGDETYAATKLGAGDEGLAEVEGRMVLSPLLARLPERERLVLNLRFVAGFSQTQIGALIGATQMQVSRILARSLAQLRAWSEPEGQ
ncbi:MAG TPA: sigma-70 family RNA polymerase sigma factor [Acidimicrobiales bacterium]|nr:sigma-70 family RNA polymerase sigma factor [Acidimicrobiales bacterium]